MRHSGPNVWRQWFAQRCDVDLESSLAKIIHLVAEIAKKSIVNTNNNMIHSHVGDSEKPKVESVEERVEQEWREGPDKVIERSNGPGEDVRCSHLKYGQSYILLT